MIKRETKEAGFEDKKQYHSYTGGGTKKKFPNQKLTKNIATFSKISWTFPPTPHSPKLEDQTCSVIYESLLNFTTEKTLLSLFFLLTLHNMAVIGVFALQGSFNKHIAALRRLGVKGVEIRKLEQLHIVSSLIIPGEESTTMAKLAEFHNMVSSIYIFPHCESLYKWESLFGEPVQGLYSWQIKLQDRKLVDNSWLVDLIVLCIEISLATRFKALRQSFQCQSSPPRKMVLKHFVEFLFVPLQLLKQGQKFKCWLIILYVLTVC